MPGGLMKNKSYEIFVSLDDDVLKIVISGSLVKKQAFDIAQAVYEIFDRYTPNKVLIDCTQFVGRLGVGDTYTHVREIKPGRHRPSRVAVFDNLENKNHFSFYETTSLNVGFNARFFGDLAKAQRWLSDKPETLP